MATTYKILGQSSPSTTGAHLYTVSTTSATAQAVVSTIVVSNVATSAKTFRIAVKPTQGTAKTDNRYWLSYDTTVPANDSIILTYGMALSGSACIEVSGSDSNVSFTAFGSEIT